MRGERLRQTDRQDAAPFVAEMATDAAVDHAKLGIPDLADTRMELARIFKTAGLGQRPLEAALPGAPPGGVLAPQSNRHQHQEYQRHHDQPVEVLPLGGLVPGVNHCEGLSEHPRTAPGRGLHGQYRCQ